MIIHRSTGGLDQEDIAASDGFLDLHVELTVGKAFADPRTVGDTQIRCDFPSQSGIRRAAEQAESPRVVLDLLLFGAGCSQESGHDARERETWYPDGSGAWDTPTTPLPPIHGF